MACEDSPHTYTNHSTSRPSLYKSITSVTISPQLFSESPCTSHVHLLKYFYSNTAYENSKDQDRYYRNHNYELTLYWSAVEHLQELGVDINTMKLKDIEDHIQKLTTDRHQLVASFKIKEKEHTKLSQMYKSFNEFYYFSCYKSEKGI